MLELKKTNHDYYCSPGYEHDYDSWERFKRSNEYTLRSRPCIVLFRFDLREYDGRWFLWLYYVDQYKGRYVKSNTVTITEKDLPEVNEFLREAKEYLFKMWEEIS